MKAPALLASLALAAALSAACAAPPGTGAIALIDDAGDTVRLAQPARRVVSLVPATTELLFAIGAGDAVVGRTHWDDWPAAAAAVTDVGDGLEPNLEMVLAQHPDLVLLYRGAGTATAASRLRALGIPALLLRTDRLADVSRIATILGRATGHLAGADSMSAIFTRELDSVSAPPSVRPSVLLLAWVDPPLTIGAGSFLDELVERAGARNLFHDVAAASGPVSLEAIAGRDPDIILSVSDSPPKLAQRPEWRAVRAVRDGRFLQIHGSEFARPGPRSPEAILELRAALASQAGAR